MLWWFVLIIPALLLSRGNLGVGILIYGISVAVLYLVSLGRHSNRRGRACGGTGRERRAMFIGGGRVCQRCGGQSRHRRAVAVSWHLDEYRTAGKHGRWPVRRGQ